MDQPHRPELFYLYLKHGIGFVLRGYLLDVAIFFGWPVCGDPREGDPTRSVGNQRFANVIFHLMKCLGIPWRADIPTWTGIKLIVGWFRDLRRDARELERIRIEVEKFSGLKLRGKSLTRYLEWLDEEMERSGGANSSLPRRD